MLVFQKHIVNAIFPALADSQGIFWLSESSALSSCHRFSYAIRVVNLCLSLQFRS